MGQDNWVTVQAEAALYADFGHETILCDRLSRPITLILKNPVLIGDVSFPTGAAKDFPTSLADRGGASAALTAGGER